MPLVIATGPGVEMRQALGTAVFFGMLRVTLLGLFLTPDFYVAIRGLVLWMERRGKLPEAQALPTLPNAAEQAAGTRSLPAGRRGACSAMTLGRRLETPLVAQHHDVRPGVRRDAIASVDAAGGIDGHRGREVGTAIETQDRHPRRRACNAPSEPPGRLRGRR